LPFRGFGRLLHGGAKALENGPQYGPHQKQQQEGYNQPDKEKPNHCDGRK
jgi:hypothetical protein